MKSVKSKDVKCAIFETLNKEPRFTHILKTVIDCIKSGQEPVVLESWSSYARKLQPDDALWQQTLTEPECALMRKCEVKTRASLNAKNTTPFREAVITLTCEKGSKTLLKKSVNAPDWLMKSLVYFGYRDHNYFKLFFKHLGYKVEEGNVSDKQGLLISLGEE